jgi:hypothetical protein
MFLQFLPLICILLFRVSSRKKLLLFISFALCVSAVYVADDFQTGVYAAILNPSSNIMPRMRTSAHLLAYKDTGHLVILDEHAEYFLEFVLVHFLSEILGLNYIIVYATVIRLVSIVMWSSLFVWALNCIGNYPRSIWFLMLAGSVLIALQGYNYEVSFAPSLLFLWSLLVIDRHFTKEYAVCSILVLIGILLASFRETVLITLLSVVTLSLTLIILKGFILQTQKLVKPKPSYVAVCLMLGLIRIFQLSSPSYVQSYIRWFFALLNSIVTTLKEGTLFKSQLLTTVSRIANPIDRMISLISIICAVSFMFFIALLCLTCILNIQKHDSFFNSGFVLYVIALALPVLDYVALILTGSSTTVEHSTFLILARSLLPLVTIGIAKNFMYHQRTSIQIKNKFKWLKCIALIVLLLCIIFAPFWTPIGEVKTSYDVIRVNVDNNIRLLTGTRVYYFICNSLTKDGKVVFLPSNERSFFSIYYSLLFKYKLGEDRIIKSEVPVSIKSAKIYDNGIYTANFYPDRLVMINSDFD